MTASAKVEPEYIDEVVGPQPGPQTDFFSIDADGILYGGAAGGGKTFALLLDDVRYIDNPHFGSVTFRRTYPQIMNEGGLWDASMKLYSKLGSKPIVGDLYWRHASGATSSFSHLQYDKDVFAHQGAEIAALKFDELTHFTKFQFLYMLSRNRSTCGVPPYWRATTNPDKNSWVREFIDWWIGKDGFPIKERAGVVRFWTVVDDKFVWFGKRSDAPEELREQLMSFTFIPASVFDNQILLDADPKYLSNLKAQTKVEREKLLDGNWNAEAKAGELFKREWFPVLKVAPTDIVSVMRFWDRAASKKKRADFTAGVLLGLRSDGSWVVLHVARFKGTPKEVQFRIKAIAQQDFERFKHLYEIGLAKDPAQAGLVDVDLLITQLSGFATRAYPESTDKVTRANAVSAHCESGNVAIVSGPWNEDFFSELEGFPDDNHDDQVDGLSGAYNAMNLERTGAFTDEMASSEETHEKPEW